VLWLVFEELGRNCSSSGFHKAYRTQSAALSPFAVCKHICIYIYIYIYIYDRLVSCSMSIFNCGRSSVILSCVSINAYMLVISKIYIYSLYWCIRTFSSVSLLWLSHRTGTFCGRQKVYFFVGQTCLCRYLGQYPCLRQMSFHPQTIYHPQHLFFFFWHVEYA